MPIYGVTLQDDNTDEWTNSPSSYLRRWLRNGTAISGQTGASYVTTANDIYKRVSLGKRAVNVMGTSLEAVSNEVMITGYNEFPADVDWVESTLAGLASNYTTVGGSVFTTIPMVHQVSHDDMGLISAADNGFKIPAAYNGRYMRFTGNMGHNWNSSTGLQLKVQKNGADAAGYGKLATGHNGGAGNAVNGSTAPIPVATDDVITMKYAHSTSGTIGSTWKDNWFAAELLPEDYSGALAKRTTNQAVAADTWTTINFESEVYDLGGYWSAGNASRFTATANGKYRLTAVAAGITAGRNNLVRIIKNGAVFYGGPHVAGWGGGAIQATSGIVDLVIGDYLEVQFYAYAGTDSVDGSVTWACLERIPDARPVALMRLGADQGVTSDVINTNTDVHDAHNLGQSASSSFLIPQGISRVRVSGAWMQNGAVSNVTFCVKKNGDLQYWGQPRHCTNSTVSAESGCGMTAIINVAPGDLLRIATIGGIDVAGTLEHTFVSIELMGDANIPDYAGDDPDWDSIIFLSGFEGSSIVNEGPSAVTAAIGSQALSTTNPLTDQKCLLSSATGTQVTIGDASTMDFAASEDFTIDCWFRPDATTATFFKAVWGRYSSDGDLNIWHMASGSSPAYGLNIVLRPEAGNVGTASVKIGFWHHLRVCRNGDTLRVFLNGALDIKLTGWGSKVINFGGAFGLLGNNVNNDRMVGAMDEFVAYRGVAKSTTDKGFNPPMRIRRAA